MPIDFTKSYPLITWGLNKTRNNLEYSLFGKKYDSARGLKVQVVQGEEILTPTDEKLRIYFNKPDGKSVYLESKKIKDGCFIIDFTNQVFAAPGDVFCELELSYGGKQLQSDTFKIKAEKSLKDGSIESKNELVVFIEALEKIETAEEKANLAHQVAQQASELLTQAQNMFTTYETAENARKTAEQNRANAENTRASNEAQRQQAETARANTFNSFMANISQQFQEKFDNIETEYLTELTEIKEDIEQLESDVDDLQLKVDLAVIDTQSGSFVQSTVADDCVAEVTIEGKTVVTPADPLQDISPDNPAIIESVGDEPFDVVATGKNLFDKSKRSIGYYIVSANGTLSSSSTSDVSDYIFVKPETSYYLSNYNVSGENRHIAFYDINKTFISSIVSSVVNKSFSTPTNAHYVRFTVAKSMVDICQLELGTEATSYESFKGSNKITISFSGKSIPNTDVVDKVELFANGKRRDTQKVGVIIFDGSEDENWGKSSANIPYFEISVGNMKPLSNILCTHYTKRNISVNDTVDVVGISVTDNRKIRIRNGNTINTSLEDFKTGLQSNPVIVLYELADSIVTESEYTPLTTYKGKTNVLTTASIQPNITAKFLSRLGNFAEVIVTKLDKLTQALLALGGTV